MEPAMTMHLTMVVVADASFGQPFSVRAVSEPFSREFREFSKKNGTETPEKRLFGEKRLY